MNPSASSRSRILAASFLLTLTTLTGVEVGKDIFTVYKTADSLLESTSDTGRISFNGTDVGLYQFNDETWISSPSMYQLQVVQIDENKVINLKNITKIGDNTLVAEVSDGYFIKGTSGNILYKFIAKNSEFLSQDIWDVKIDFDNSTVTWAPQMSGFYNITNGKPRFLIGPVDISRDLSPPGQLMQIQTGEGHLTLATPTKEWWEKLVEKGSLAIGMISTKIKMPSFPGSDGYLNFVIEDLKIDNLNKIYGLKAKIGSKLAGKELPGAYLGEVSFKFPPEFGLNSFGLGQDNMDIPLVSLPGVFWQRAFASVENIMLPPWYIHGEAGFSLGPLEEKNPWLGGYPFYVLGTLDIKSNLYIHGHVKGSVYIFPVSSADLIVDPTYKKFSFSVTDLPAVPFLISGAFSTVDGNFTASANARVGIPKTVPVIGGASLAGVTVGLEANIPGKTADFHGEFKYSVTPRVPPKCVQVPHNVTIRTSRVWWDSCCTKVWGVCVGCPRTDFFNNIKVEYSEVCTPEIPETAGLFRVGVKIDSNGSHTYFNQQGAYNTIDQRFTHLYLADKYDWETPFYYYEKGENGEIQYYNYNWDRLDRIESARGAFKPAQLTPGIGEYAFFTDGKTPVILRFHYEKEFENNDHLDVTAPNGRVYTAVEDNRPHGYLEEHLISCHHDREHKEIVYFIPKPLEGPYTVKLNLQSSVGGFVIEGYAQNHKPVVLSKKVRNFRPNNIIGNDSLIEVEVEAVDFDTSSDKVKTSVFLDHNPEGFDGIKIGDFNLSEIETSGSIVIDTSSFDIPTGKYYVYAKLDDQINTPLLTYFDESIVLGYSPLDDTIVDYKIAPINNGLEIAIDHSANENEGYYYQVSVQKEFNTDHTGHTETYHEFPYRRKILGLENGQPYIISVIAINADGHRTSPQNYRRVIPGIVGDRPIKVASQPIPSVSPNSPIHYRLETFDGDLIEKYPEGTRFYTDLEFELLPNITDATINDRGLFSWTPTTQDVGDHEFTVLLRKWILNDGKRELSDLPVAEHSFRIHVSSGENVASHFLHENRFYSHPDLTAVSGSQYEYNPAITKGFDQGYQIKLIEGPEGMVFDQTTNTLLWQNVQATYGDFVHLNLIDNANNIIDTQRWFLDIHTEDRLLNDRIVISDVRIASYRTDDDDLDEIAIFWNAPEGSYEAHILDTLDSEATPMGTLPVEGGYGQITKLRIPGKRTSTFIKIKSQE